MNPRYPNDPNDPDQGGFFDGRRPATEEELGLGASPDKHLARSHDPESAQEGARMIGPTRGTKMAKVLWYLATHDWVTVYEICNPSVGGSSGDRRMRELSKDFGWTIRHRYLRGRSEFMLDRDEAKQVRARRALDR